MNKQQIEDNPLDLHLEQLPQGWAIIPLPGCIYFQEGPGLRKWQFGESGIPFLNIRTFNNGIIDKTKCQFVKKEEFDGKYEHFLLDAGDIIVSSSGTIGKVAIIRQNDLPLMLNTSVIRFRSLYPNNLLQEYLKYYLQSQHFFSQLGTSITGSAISNYGPSHLKKMCILVPPANEQRHIVEKLEKILTKVDTCKQRLDKIPNILKRFRQSVLAAACSGRLTADWRENNPDVEPASELLKRIQKERKNQSKNKEIVVEYVEENEIPETWIAVNFGTLIGELKNGISPRPNMEPPGTPVLRISAVRGGKIDLSDVRYLLDADKFIPTYALQEKDLIFTRYNGTLDLVGACSMVRDIGEKIILYPDKLIRARFDHDLIEPGYAEIFFQTPAVREKITSKSKSSAGQNGISGQDIKNQHFTIPPLTEQQEIVNRVQTLFKLADHIEQRYQKAKNHIDQLTQSILAKAFRGELVPQDPNDEPASVLLERIRAERTKRETETKTAKKSTGQKGKRRSKKQEQQPLEPIQLELPLDK